MGTHNPSVKKKIFLLYTIATLFGLYSIPCFDKKIEYGKKKVFIFSIIISVVLQIIIY